MKGLKFLSLVKSLLGDEFECEKQIVHTCKNGIRIIGSGDIFHIPLGTVIELKTRQIAYHSVIDRILSNIQDYISSDTKWELEKVEGFLELLRTHPNTDNTEDAEVVE